MYEDRHMITSIIIYFYCKKINIKVAGMVIIIYIIHV